MNEPEPTKFTLEGTLSADTYERIAWAATAKWEGGPYTLSSDEVDAVVWQRHDNTVRFVVPWIEEHLPLNGAKVIDIGCGCGSSSLALSHFAQQVSGIEIDVPSVEAFRVRMETFGVDNARVIQSQPEDVLADCLDLLDERSVVLMLAVVEHLTPEEQIDYLSSIWEALKPGQALVIAETPNYLGLVDTHTFGLPFAHMTQGAQFEAWLKAAPPDLRFRKYLLSIADSQGPEALLTERFRLGMGVAPQVFELALGEDLNEVVIADGFSEPISDWFPLIPDDYRLLAEFRDLEVDLPIGFARSVLSFIFRKPRTRKDAAAARQWNEERRASLPSVLGVQGAGESGDPALDSVLALLAEREKELDAIYGSRSWRMSEPLRGLGNLVRRRLNR